MNYRYASKLIEKRKHPVNDITLQEARDYNDRFPSVSPALSSRSENSSLSNRTTADEVKTRWRTLRERYSKELRECKPRSGQAAAEFESSWEYFQAMGFLKNHMMFRKTLSMLKVQAGESSFSCLKNKRKSTPNTEELSKDEELEEFQCDVDSGWISQAGPSRTHTPSLSLSVESGSSQSQIQRGESCSTPSQTPSFKRGNRKRSAVDPIDREILNSLKNLEKDDADDAFGKVVACELEEEKALNFFQIVMGLDDY
ncbi:unnamed protein product [Brassicogethes aeneus]|uniref:MADF domain-containing protein n=1 Tax=Brassicogethes aeneus TaxID=1431903 RepID=A0A9P0FNM1_BRAAE|nr:unnamed protein product [Brassicogethes aeneus]